MNATKKKKEEKNLCLVSLAWQKCLPFKIELTEPCYSYMLSRFEENPIDLTYHPTVVHKNVALFVNFNFQSMFKTNIF